MADKKETKRPRGRPRLEIDLEMVEDLVSVGCTQEEIASIMGFERTLFNTRKELNNIYKKGMDTFRASIRRQQWLRARAGDTGMLIWLGKQLLGQREKQDIDMKAAMSAVEIVIDGKPKDAD